MRGQGADPGLARPVGASGLLRTASPSRACGILGAMSLKHPGLPWLFVAAPAWGWLVSATSGSGLYPAVLLLGLVGAPLLVERLLTWTSLPYEGAERRWRELGRRVPLTLTTYGGTRPPRGRFTLGRVRVDVRDAGGAWLVRVRLQDPRADAGDLAFDGAAAPADLDLGDARLCLGVEGALETVLAALTEPVRDALAGQVVGRAVRVEPGLARSYEPHALSHPEALLDKVRAFEALLVALDEALDRPLEEALRADDPSPSVRAARARRLFARGFDGALAHARALAEEPPPLRWAGAEAFAAAPRAEDRARGLRLLREALAHGDRAARRHALEVAGRRLPRALARRIAAEDALRPGASLRPEAVSLLDPAALRAPWLFEVLDAQEPEALRRLVPALAAQGARPALLHLAAHPRAEVGLDALAALARIGRLDCVPGLLALARTWRTPARRGAALLTARRLQARHGHPARGALSDARPDAGRLSEPAA